MRRLARLLVLLRGEHGADAGGHLAVVLVVGARHEVKPAQLRPVAARKGGRAGHGRAERAREARHRGWILPHVLRGRPRLLQQGRANPKERWRCREKGGAFK